jgi:hypothetical protein
MSAFFQPLIDDILTLFGNQAALADEDGHPPTHFVLTGGLGRNRRCRDLIFEGARKLLPGIECSYEIA